MRKAARFLISVVLILGLCFLFLNLKTNTYAQISSPYSTPVNNADVPQNLHTYSQNVMLEIMSAMICQLTGIDPIRKDHKCLGIDVENGKIGYVEGPKNGMAGGAIGSMSNLIGYTFQIPVHTGDYVTYLASNFGITKQTYADTDCQGLGRRCGGAVPCCEGLKCNQSTQTCEADPTAGTSVTVSGTGFESLKPLLPVWTKFRDIVYVLFVLAFVIVGLGIMLRVKIDPRTVMTIQNQIPKIIIGIILITFSYAIAGFLIDIMWTLIYLLINLFASVDPKIMELNPDTNLSYLKTFYDTQNQNVIKYAQETMGAKNIAVESARGFESIIGAALDNDPGNALKMLLGSIVGGSLGGTLGKAISGIANFGGWIGSIVGVIGGAAIGIASANYITEKIVGLIAFLVIIIAVFAALFRLWFKLLIAFIYILIGVVLSPLWIITGIIPGSKLGFGSWIKYMLSNLIVFPLTIAMFLIGKVFIDVFDKAVTDGSAMFVPPLIGYGGTLAPITALIALGIILATPNVTKYAQEIFKSPKLDMSPIGQAIKSGASPIASGGKKTWGTLTRYPDQYRGIKAGALRQLGRSIKDVGQTDAQESRRNHPMVNKTLNWIGRQKEKIVSPEKYSEPRARSAGREYNSWVYEPEKTNNPSVSKTPIVQKENKNNNDDAPGEVL